MKNSTNSISPFVITKENLKLYLVQKGLLKKGEQAVIVPLDGGFVNPIFRVTNTTKDFVVKQAMESSSKIASFTKLARERSGYEFQFLRLIRERLSHCVRVPQVFLYDSANFILVEEAVTPHAKLYWNELPEGRFHFDVAHQLGIYVAGLQNMSYNDPVLKAQFLENPGYRVRELSIIPAFEKYPQHQQRFEEAMIKNRKNAWCLVDADITPKNMLVHDGTFTKIDFEIMQYGDPALDIGIVIAHFLIYCFPHPQWKEEYLACAQLFWDAYQKQVAFSLPKAFFCNMKNYLALMIIGRIDAVSIYPWMNEKQAKVRVAAVEIFDTDVKNLDEIAAIIEKYL